MKKILLVIIGVSVAFAANIIRDNAKEVVVDSATHLMWQDNEDAKTVTKSWIEAIEYCESLTLAGFDDWRLPNIRELKYIADINKINPAIVTGFENIAADYYWSSSTVMINSYSAWGVYFWYGNSAQSGKKYVNYIRCVRDSN